ncbi:PAS domain S-box protein [Mucilaginibacter sp. JRF]|uniref:sensor histidine kinase n=1 Tax=Mucilaginibacter sp. JRF TaxID=2780088 RepID=UPI001882F75F|nr:ATP-binding protein [Mucilaginibacter sp. JRF]MBE9584864.1 PAS domain S-box protein [Mucilaginibacter sp. JRF]
MPSAPVPRNEQERLASLQSYHILDTATEKDFDELAELASAICDTPVALISFVDKDRQWFKARKGVDISETDRALSFCAHAINKPNEILEVEDARRDKRFADNDLVTGDTNLVFYAGVPLVDNAGYPLGSLCVIDREKKQLNDMQRSALKVLANQVMDKLTLRKKILELQESKNRNSRLNKLLMTKEQEAMQIIKNTPMAMALHVGLDMTIRFANDMMLKAWDKDELVFHMPFAKALPELAALDFPSTMRQVYRTGIRYEQTEAHMSYEHQGEIKQFYYNYAFTPLKDENGQVWGILNTAFDMTAVVRNRLAAESAEEQLRLAVQSADLGTWYINASTREFIASPKLKELFGYSANEPMGYEAAIAQIPDEHRDRIAHAVEDTLNHGTAYDVEYPIVGYRDKKLRWVRATGNLFKSGGDTAAAHFSGTIADITERREDEQRKNDFIGMVSHELKTPLTSISGYTQLQLARTIKADDKAGQELAIKSKRQVDRMQALITGFLDVARLTEGKIRLNKKEFDMATLFDISAHELLAVHTTHKLIFHKVEAISIHADQEKIEQVLVNFINNAVKYSQSGSEINVDCIAQDNHITVSVTDQGFGVSPKDQKHIFERFYRVDNAKTNQISGFGIGLYVCKEIVERHGGQTGVESEIGQGSRFWFTLPLGL